MKIGPEWRNSPKSEVHSLNRQLITAPFNFLVNVDSSGAASAAQIAAMGSCFDTPQPKERSPDLEFFGYSFRPKYVAVQTTTPRSQRLSSGEMEPIFTPDTDSEDDEVERLLEERKTKEEAEEEATDSGFDTGQWDDVQLRNVPRTTSTPWNSPERCGFFNYKSMTAYDKRRLFHILYKGDRSPHSQLSTLSSSSNVSVDLILKARKTDPEQVLSGIGLGTNAAAVHPLVRVPTRFLQPSQVRGNSIEDFISRELLSWNVNYNPAFLSSISLSRSSASSSFSY